jgi:predicted Zn-dependent protease
MEQQFLEVAALIDRSLEPGEVFTICFAAEDTDFIRFNRGRVRQPGSVTQAQLSLDLIRGRRHAIVDLTLSRDAAFDHDEIRAAVASARALLADCPEDPYLLYATEVRSSVTRRHGRLPSPEQAIAAVTGSAKGSDLVGIYAAGRIYRGFANAFGQRNWHEVENFNFDCSFHHRDD